MINNSGVNFNFKYKLDRFCFDVHLIFRLEYFVWTIFIQTLMK